MLPPLVWNAEATRSLLTDTTSFGFKAIEFRRISLSAILLMYPNTADYRIMYRVGYDVMLRMSGPP